MRPIYVITGITGTGKSAVAMELARRMGGEILSCDSTQFYRGLDIGTAKITMEERRGVPHHGLDLVELDQCFNVEQFVTYARHVVDEVWARERDIFVVGGSGFYLLSFYRAVFDAVNVPSEIRIFVHQLWQTGGMRTIRAKLLEYNSRLPLELTQNPVRALRALERCMATGRSVAEMRDDFDQQIGPFDRIPKVTICVERSLEIWENGLRERIANMLQNGLIEEVIQLRAKGLERHPTISRAVGYREVLAFLNGDIPAGELAERIFCHTRQLAHKQRTWLRHKIPQSTTISADRLAPDAADNMLHLVQQANHSA
ncbi:MAG: tRNA (adenosine(37)-N6)-dimethylallyltransferase MiaA [Puniceicoccales bacterium]|jgi:tRNA dimethylallyltransferase|nr:tRNA (adenosine(37)-N6)-dimethylallyltransferase MiaA [Puniceicoccales bacterium]